MNLNEAIGVINCDICKATGKKLAHKEIYTRAINTLGGLDAVIPYIPFTLMEIKEALPQDKHLNNLRLHTWDVAVGEISPRNWLLSNRDDEIIKNNKRLKNLCKKNNINITAAEGVCILKEAARQWIEREVYNMTVYALIYSVGISCGRTDLIGIYSTMEKAEEIKQADMKQNARNDWYYSIKPIEIDKTVNITYQEW